MWEVAKHRPIQRFNRTALFISENKYHLVLYFWSNARLGTRGRSSEDDKSLNNPLFSDESDIESAGDSTDDDAISVSKRLNGEDNSDSDSDLNYSDICPLEDIIPNFEDIGERYKITDYLQVKI